MRTLAPPPGHARLRRRVALRPSVALATLVSCLGVAGCTELRGQNDIVRDGGAADTGPVVDMGPEPCPALSARPEVVIGAAGTSTDIETSSPAELREWTCANRYRIEGQVFVLGAEGAPLTLTIGRGTVVEAGPDALLMITRFARIEAAGTREDPIVFTSAASSPSEGDWRGLVILGDGPSSLPPGSEVSRAANAGDVRAGFGRGPGGDPTEDCGTLEYVRVEFAGVNPDSTFEPESGLTLAGCGTDTTVDFVQVHRGTDGLGLYGGTVNLTHVLVTMSTGDGIEWTGGYTGNMQYVVVQQPQLRGPAIKGNNIDGNPNAAPRSAPTIFNATLVSQVGAATSRGLDQGVRFQFGSGGTIRNSMILDFTAYAVDITNTSSAALATGLDSELAVTHTTFFRNATVYGTPEDDLASQFPGDEEPEPDDEDQENDGSFPEDTYFPDPSFRQRITDPRLEDAFADPPSFVGGNVEPGAGRFFVPEAGSFFAAESYVGALPPMGVAPWTEGWTAFP